MAFPLSNEKSLLNLQQQSCSFKCLEVNREQISKLMHAYNDFSARPRYGAMFEALCFRNGRVDLQV